MTPLALRWKRTVQQDPCAADVMNKDCSVLHTQPDMAVSPGSRLPLLHGGPSGARAPASTSRSGLKRASPRQKNVLWVPRDVPCVTSSQKEARRAHRERAWPYARARGAAAAHSHSKEPQAAKTLTVLPTVFQSVLGAYRSSGPKPAREQDVRALG